MDRPDDYDIYLNEAMKNQEEQYYDDLQKKFEHFRIVGNETYSK